MLAERGAKVGVEIGTDHGKYAQQLLEGIPGLDLLCVDPYLAYTEGEEIHSQEEMEQIYKEALQRVASYDCHIDRNTSMEVVKHIPDNFYDFVFIDGNHSYEYVLEDITEWTKKVKPGGIVAGHDYKEDPTRNYGVIQAVQEYTEENHIAPLFEFRGGGRLVPCWMFFKQ
ncbi:MAG: class I SAM-dependent methyltransferase [Candidatus Curtissbacteria bacterium]|nr:class I SAM-dependent methyltransferase [Candidatus Curtissbacteria bacterium]